jgi:hypothetical protein
MRKILSRIGLGVLAVWWFLGFLGNLQTAQTLFQNRGEVMRIIGVVLTSQWLPLGLFLGGAAVLFCARRGFPRVAAKEKTQPAPLIKAWVRVMSSEPQFALVLHVWLQNVGNRSARSVRVHLEHSKTNTLAYDADQLWWRRPISGMFAPLNPWELECTRVINPDEKVPVISIPFREMPLDEAWLRLRITAEDMNSINAACRFSPKDLDLQKEVRVPFSGE